MTKTPVNECMNCGKQVVPERRNYRYTESGIPNIVLQGVAVADCPACGNADVSIPRMTMIHRAIARALANSCVPR
jgi:YgiT-type zinc finger domain-containing protein